MIPLHYYRFQSQCYRDKKEFRYVPVCIRVHIDFYRHLCLRLCTEQAAVLRFVCRTLCQLRCTVSHLDFHLFEPNIHSWPELCHLLLQSNQLAVPRAHVRAQLGDAGITPEIIGEGSREGPLNENSGMGGSWGKVWRQRGVSRKLEKTERKCPILKRFTWKTNR